MEEEMTGYSWLLLFTLLNNLDMAHDDIKKITMFGFATEDHT